ncbi:hypothetical protein R3W88_023939 [Solanum pinnatisectum]|uniref:Uncharacterized protein n=1 Tax=Solanum pinnatisectum TaxID=50273 RepID=A0AAV9LYY0_9SOLN|nr:hypothetical protein R3W88_023939 [Solanum pinnatisectum]
MMLTTRGATSYNCQPPPGYPDSRYYVCNNQAIFRSPRPMQNHQNNAPHPNFEKKPPESSLHYCEYFSRVVLPKNKRCAYHSGVVRYDIEKCITLKHKIQGLIDNEVIKLAQAPRNMNTIPLPKHKE